MQIHIAYHILMIALLLYFRILYFLRKNAWGIKSIGPSISVRTLTLSFRVRSLVGKVNRLLKF